MSTNDTEYVLVTEYFHPDTASTGQLMTDLAVGLQERGLDMTVYTGQPNYHSGENKKQPRHSTYEGVTVKRIRAPQVRQTSFLRRGFNWIVFTIWMFFTLLRSRSETDRELLFVSNPPFLPLVMWLLCRIRGWEYTYIVYDLYPDFVVEAGYVAENGLVDRVWSWGTRQVFRAAENIVALGPVMRDRILRNAGPDVREDKVEIIHNWADEEFITPTAKEDNWFSQEHGLVDRFTLLYSGNIGGNHDLETIVRAAQDVDDDVLFLIIGEGDAKDDVVALAEELGVIGSTVEFLPYQPTTDLPYSLTAGDISLVSVEAGMEGICVSSKLYTALATGQPILVVSHPQDDEAQIVKQFNAGFAVQQGDTEGIVEAIDRWRSDPDHLDAQGTNAREAFESHFTREQSVDDYHELLTN